MEEKKLIHFGSFDERFCGSTEHLRQFACERVREIGGKMPWIEISDEAHEALVRNGVSRYAEKRRAAVGWSIPLEWDTIERLNRARFEGESYSDVIIRILTKPS